MTSDAAGENRRDASEALFEALRAVLDSLLSALVMRGLLNRAELEQLFRNAEENLQSKEPHRSALEALAAIRADLPAHLRAAQGPEPDPEHDHDH